MERLSVFKFVSHGCVADSSLTSMISAVAELLRTRLPKDVIMEAELREDEVGFAFEVAIKLEDEFELLTSKGRTPKAAVMQLVQRLQAAKV
jgi:hypothetical protein